MDAPNTRLSHPRNMNTVPLSHSVSPANPTPKVSSRQLVTRARQWEVLVPSAARAPDTAPDRRAGHGGRTQLWFGVGLEIRRSHWDKQMTPPMPRVRPVRRRGSGIDNPAATQLSYTLTFATSALDSPSSGSSQSSPPVSLYSMPPARHSVCTPAPFASGRSSTTNNASN